MGETYAHLGAYSDWVRYAGEQATLYPQPSDTPALTCGEVRELIGFPAPGRAQDPRVERSWTAEGIAGEEVSWSVGYGPRTIGWVLRPADAKGPLPGVLAMHGHDGFKFFGKEKVADGPGGISSYVRTLRQEHYESRAWANDLAKRGFTVLVHDVFSWGSRRFAADLMRPRPLPEPEELWTGANPDINPERDVVAYNRAARSHEHLIAKYCTLLGATLAGVVAYEDRCAAAYLRSRSDVIGRSVGCVGLSGGGCRSALLNATDEDITAAVVVGMMTTHPELLDHLVSNHTWMFFPAGLARRGDWPDLAAARAPSPLLVQFNRDDQLFTPTGMQAADEKLRKRYQQAGAPDGYVGEFFDGPHKFDQAMQYSAFEFLSTRLTRSPAQRA